MGVLNKRTLKEEAMERWVLKPEHGGNAVWPRGKQNQEGPTE